MQSSEEIERKRATECLYKLLVTYYNELERNPFEVHTVHITHKLTVLCGPE